MKKCYLVLVSLSILLFTGCASYQATSLSALDPNCIKTYSGVEGVLIGCKLYSKQECYDYLDRDVLAKGYQPIQLTFQNTSDKHYLFSTKSVGLPCVTTEEVAKAVHTATVGRILGYSIGGLIALPLFIPAIVDGIKSSNANNALDRDFADKAKESFVIAPNSFKKTLIFVSKEQVQSVFDITLLEEESGTYKTVALSTIH